MKHYMTDNEDLAYELWRDEKIEREYEQRLKEGGGTTLGHLLTMAWNHEQPYLVIVKRAKEWENHLKAYLNNNL